MVDHSTAVATREPGQLGPPETITLQEAGKFLGLVKRGLSDDMAAACVGRSCSGLKDYCNRYRDLALRLGEAKAHKPLFHMKQLNRISRTTDVRGLNAAVKAAEAMLRATDPRFRKDPDAMTPGVGGGVTIIVRSGSEQPSGQVFAGTGGVIDAEAVTVLESRADLGVDAVTKPATIEDLIEANPDIAGELREIASDPEPQTQPGREAAVVAEIEGGGDPDGANEASAEERTDGQEYF